MNAFGGAADNEMHLLVKMWTFLVSDFVLSQDSLPQIYQSAGMVWYGIVEFNVSLDTV